MENELEVIQQKEESVFINKTGYETAYEMAKMLSTSDLVPATYNGKPSNCLIALDVARRIKNSPLVVMQNLNIIKGKPSWSSTYVAAAIRSRYRNVRLIMSGEAGKDNWGCKVVVYDDNKEIIAEGATVTLAMAKAEGWYGKLGSKWKTMPKLMLQYRANAFFGRVFCPDKLIGIQSEYEVIDVTKNVLEAPKTTNIFEEAKKENVVEKAEVVEEKPVDPDEKRKSELRAAHKTYAEWQIEAIIQEEKDAINK